MAKRGADDKPPGTLFKAGPATVDHVERLKSWRIRCTYYPKQRANGDRRELYDYPTKEAAEAEAEQYRLALHTDGAARWIKWDKAKSVADNANRNDTYYPYNKNGPAPKNHRGMERLNASRRQLFKKFKDLEPEITRLRFADVESGGQSEIARWLRRQQRRQRLDGRRRQAACEEAGG